MSLKRVVRFTAMALVLGFPSGRPVVAADGTAAPEVAAGAVEPLGTTGMTVNGTIHPRGSATTWFVEFGPTTAYGQKTRVAPLPPRLAAHYLETWNHGLGGWSGGLGAGDPLKLLSEEGAVRGFVRASEPMGDDPNHVDGIGTLHLCKYFYPGMHPGPGNLLISLGGGDPDLRDAKVSLSVRGNQWQPNGAELCWWTQSQSNIELLSNPGWRRANWAYTGHGLTDLLQSGKWERGEYRLLNDSSQWTYGGNNLAQKRPNYDYWSIDDSQRHLNIDAFHLLAFVNPAKRPTGSIDFDNFEVTYHNYSVLLESNGGRLVKSPQGAPDDAARLTDGWRHGEEKMWRSAASPAGPQEFVWKLERPVGIETVQVHQHTEWPSKTVEVSVSEDGEKFAPLVTLTLPENSPQGPNLAQALARPKKTEAKFVKFAITAGYKAEAWGLGEIELFGSGATMLPEDEPNHVSIDIPGLEAGKTYHYRIVATNASGTTPGADRAFTAPATTQPWVATGPAIRITGTSAKLDGRINPLGQRTQFFFEYGPDTSYGQKTAETYGGLQITPRAAFLEVTGLNPATTYHYRLVAVNETGRTVGADATFTTREK